MRLPRWEIAGALLLLIIRPLSQPSWGGGGDPEEATRLAAQARERQDRGQFAEAAEIAKQALAIREQQLGANHPDTAESLHDLAEAYRSLGEYAKALPMARRALDIRERVLGKDHLATAASLNDLGLLHFEMGDCRDASNCREALPLIERALRIRRQRLGPNHIDVSESLNNLAVLYRAQKKYQEALPLFEQALGIKQDSLAANHPRIAGAHTNLAALYLQWADETREADERDRRRIKALEHLQAAKAILRPQAESQASPSEQLLAARNVTNLARFYWKLGTVAHDQARELLQQAVAIRARILGDHHPDTAQSRNLLAAFQQTAKAYGEALTIYRNGLATENQVIEHVLLSAASDEQKLSFLRKSQWHYWAALSLIHRHFSHDDPAVRFALDLILRRKGVVLDAQSRAQEALAQNMQGETLEAWNRLTQHRTELSRLLLSGPSEEDPTRWRQAIKELQEAVAQEQEFLARRSGLLARQLAQQQISAEQLARHLPHNSVLVEFVRIRDWDEDVAAWSPVSRYLAFVLTPDNRVRLIDLGDARRIEGAIESTREAINDARLFERDLAAYRRTTEQWLAELYTRLLLPLDSTLKERRDLIISPDGDLNRVPFDALRTADGHYLVERHVVAYVTSGRDLLPREAGKASAVELVLVANPAFDDRDAVHTTPNATRALRPPFRQKFGPLPGTKEEAELIQPLLGGEKHVLLGSAATETAVRAAHAPQILHLATHGFFLPPAVLADLFSQEGPGSQERARLSTEQADAVGEVDNPMVFSGLALAGANHANLVAQGDDGILTALEVSGMNLYGTDLVVLSACETALGKVESGEGVYGLRRAFVLAGARNLVMSLWPVDDETTRDLMVRFYRAYARGTRVAQALHQAQLETIANLRERYQQAPVNLWAAFVAQQTGT